MDPISDVTRMMKMEAIRSCVYVVELSAAHASDASDSTSDMVEVGVEVEKRRDRRESRVVVGLSVEWRG